MKELRAAVPLLVFALSAGCTVHTTGLQTVVVAGTDAAKAPPADVAAAGREAARPENPTPSEWIAGGRSLVGFWRFEEGTGATVVDLSGNHNDGGVVNASWSTDRAPVASDRYALDFDGAAYVRVRASDSLAIDSTLTVAAWIKPNDTAVDGTAGVVSQARPDGGTGYRLGVEEGRANLGLNNGRSWNCSVRSRSTLDTGRWAHIAGTYDGETMRIYVNGELEGTSSCASGSLMRSSRPVYIGREFDILGGRPFDGIIDEARVYDVVLDDSAVRSLFAEGRG